MNRVVVSAETLADTFNFMVPEHSAPHKAIKIIQAMNLRTTPDPQGILASIANRNVVVLPSNPPTEPFQLEIQLNGVTIYMDHQLKDEQNAQLQEVNFKNEREFCVVQ